MPSWDLCLFVASTTQEIRRMGDLKWFVQDNSQQNIGVSTAEALAVVLRPPLWPGAVQ